MRIFKKIIYFLVGIFTFLVGLICLAIPFLPFGWLLLIVTLILFLPYFPSTRKWLTWLERKDKSGFSRKMKKYSTEFYNWCHEIKPDVVQKDKSLASRENSD